MVSENTINHLFVERNGKKSGGNIDILTREFTHFVKCHGKKSTVGQTNISDPLFCRVTQFVHGRDSGLCETSQRAEQDLAETWQSRKVKGHGADQQQQRGT